MISMEDFLRYDMGWRAFICDAEEEKLQLFEKWLQTPGHYKGYWLGDMRDEKKVLCTYGSIITCFDESYLKRKPEFTWHQVELARNPTSVDDLI